MESGSAFVFQKICVSQIYLRLGQPQGFYVVYVILLCIVNLAPTALDRASTTAETEKTISRRIQGGTKQFQAGEISG